MESVEFRESYTKLRTIGFVESVGFCKSYSRVRDIGFIWLVQRLVCHVGVDGFGLVAWNEVARAWIT